MSSLTGWVKAPSASKGLDPLGVQAPCINLYGRLLPGITNVTDRARYYSFYPWFFSTLDKKYPIKTWSKVVDQFRRADCLFTLIAARHARVTDNDDYRHGIAMIGRDKLLPALDALEKGATLALSEFATLQEDSPNRYFKNKLGGLGQYYIGTLRDLGLLDGNSRVGVQYVIERAPKVTKPLDGGVNGGQFFKTIENDIVELKDLDDLISFCPCQLYRNKAEEQALQDLFFDREKIYEEDGAQRRLTLGLLLHLIRELEEDSVPVPLDHFVFRGCVYTGYLPKGRKWTLPPVLNETRQAWGVYQQNELLSMALQGIFWVATRFLQVIEPPVYSTEAFQESFSRWEEVHKALGEKKEQKFPDAVEKAKELLPNLSAWQDSNHEIALGRSVREIYRSQKKEKPYEAILRVSLETIFALVARGIIDNQPYGRFTFDDDYFSYYPVNLRSLMHHVRGLWQDFSLQHLVGWLAGHWGIETHLRVALRKLHHEKLDTFHVRPTERGLVVIHEPDLVFTSPRFKQAIQILKDIGAVDQVVGRNHLQLTDQGHALLGEICGS